MKKRSKVSSMDHESKTIVDVIFEDTSTQLRATQTPVLHPSFAWGAAIFIHLGLFIFANNTEMSLETWSARMATLIHQELAKKAPISVDSIMKPIVKPPQLERTKPLEELRETNLLKVKEKSAPQKKVRLKRAKAKSSPKVQSKKKSPSPGQAAKLIATAPSNDAPLDLTQETFVTGEGHTYAGGVTTSNGQSKTKVDQVSTEQETTRKEERSVKKPYVPVSLSTGAWRCAWPKNAMEQAIFEQAVVLKVVVEKTGKVTQVLLIDDPGFGFGEAARRCAFKTKFTPAKNSQGHSIRALSPSIRVRFTR